MWFGGANRSTRFRFMSIKTPRDFETARKQTENGSAIKNRIDVWPDLVDEVGIPGPSDRVDDLVRATKLPAPPMALATAPAHDPELDKVVSAEVASELITKVAGKRLATTAAARRIPFVGGFVGMGADGFATWRVGRYADRELLPRARR